MKPARTVIVAIVAVLAFGLSVGWGRTPRPAARVTEPAAITITQPDGVGDVVGEGTDFATTELARPWDMQSDPYPDYSAVLVNFDRDSFVAADGQWQAFTASSGPRFSIHPTGLAQPVLDLGNRVPIDGQKYRYLTVRMYLSQGGVGQVFWFYDDRFKMYAGSNFFPVQSGWQTYVVDLYAINTNTVVGGAPDWENGVPMGLSIDPISSGTNVEVRLDWVRLTTGDTTNTYPIAWAGLSPSGAGHTLEFYLDDDNSGFDGIKIATIFDPAAADSFAWGSSPIDLGSGLILPLPESFEPGDYYVYATLDGADQSYSPGPLTIDRMPQLTFINPTYTSGDDYSQQVVGDRWDMSDGADFILTRDMAGMTYSGDILTGVTGGTGDSWLHLNVTTPIDPTTYKYLTYRYKLNRTRDVGKGSVARFYWWQTRPEVDFTVTDDMLIYEGWHTYTVDLSQVQVEPNSLWPDWSGAPTVFRFDPHEFPGEPGLTFELDEIWLTAAPQIQANSPYTITVQVDDNAADWTASFYYDTDRDPAAKTPMTLVTPPGGGAPGTGPFFVYLPLAVKNYAPGYKIVVWDTTGVSPGTYWVAVELSDGYNTATWYSQMSVEVTN